MAIKCLYIIYKHFVVADIPVPTTAAAEAEFVNDVSNFRASNRRNIYRYGDIFKMLFCRWRNRNHTSIMAKTAI